MVDAETIAAIATAPGRGGIAVVRVSGPGAFALAERLTGRKVRPGRIALCRIRASSAPDAAVLDEGVVLAFKAPGSYTGEDVVEFQCHGGEVTPRRVLEACFGAGARLARRGEFTCRAFLNGRLDLDQAEAVLDLIDAKTSRAADAAIEGLSGSKRRSCRDLYDRVLALGSDLEHALDIEEGELPDGFAEDAADRLRKLEAALATVLRHLHEGKILRRGALVVLSGPPNVGKSSLMNALLEENRVLVSDQAGTTRDSVEEWYDLEGWPVRLVDTAGLRQTGDAIEAEGVRRAETLADEADVVLLLAEKAGEWPRTVDARTIRVLNKCDLPPNANAAQTADAVLVSAKTGFGLGDLKRAILNRLRETAANRSEETLGGDERTACLLGEARDALAEATARGADDLVLAANAVRLAGERLGEAVGGTYSADMLDRLFTRFCVGK